jgi:hypothetical protein
MTKKIQTGNLRGRPTCVGTFVRFRKIMEQGSFSGSLSELQQSENQRNKIVRMMILNKYVK